MNNLGYIYLSKSTNNKDIGIKGFLQSTIKKHSLLHRFLKCEQYLKQNEDINIIMIEIPIISVYHLNKAEEIINKFGAANIIIQDCIEEYIENNQILIKFNILKGIELKEALINMALEKFLKYSPKPIEKCNVLLVVDEFYKNDFKNVYMDLVEFIINLARKSRNITLLFNSVNSEKIYTEEANREYTDLDELKYAEELILDDTGLCPICTFNLETALEQDNQIIINLSKMKINYKELKLINKNCIIFDLNRKNNKNDKECNFISDYMVIPPKKYRNIELKEVYAKLVESIFYIKNSDIDLLYIRNSNSISEYNNFLRVIKDQGFDVRLK